MDLMSVCRTCMSSSSLNPIFPLPEVHEKFSDAIYLITGIKVALDDGLPQKMCIECLKHVNDAMKFRAKCKETEETLLKIKSEVRRAVRHNERIVNYRSDFIREIKVGNRWIKIQPTNNVMPENQEQGNDDEDEQPLMHLLNADTNDIQNIYITDETGEHMIPLEMLKVEMDSRQVDASNYAEKTADDPEDADVNEADYDVEHLEDIVDDTDAVNTQEGIASGDEDIAHEQDDVVDNPEDAIEDHPEYTIINIQGNVNDHEINSDEQELTYEDQGETIDEAGDNNQEDAVNDPEDTFNDPEYCKWEFEKEDALIEHVVTCTAKKKRKASDSNHERRHRGEKPYVCELCGAKFHAAYLLTQHRHSHTSERKFKCEVCGVSFKTNNGLHSHRRSCHGGARRLRRNRALDGVTDAQSEINDI